MLALAFANAVGVILFGTLYVVAGLQYLSQAAFLLCLGILFLLVTQLWVRVEARHGGLAPIHRVGRIAAGLSAVVIAVPAVVLMPMFWLDAQLPVEAGLHERRGSIMALIFITLTLTALVNVVGAVVIASRASRGRNLA